MARRIIATVSPANSTISNLGPGGIFTGVFEPVIGYSALVINVLSDQNSAVNGLTFRWSFDGVSTVLTDTIQVLAGIGKAFSVVPRAPFFRVEYENGPTAQSSFILGCVYQPVGTGLVSRPLGEPLDLDNFASPVRATMLALNSAGEEFSNLRLTALGALRMAETERKSGASAVTRVAVSTTSAQLLASNPSRVFAVIHNESGSRVLYVKFGTTASVTDYTYRVKSQEAIEVKHYTGRIDAILSTGSDVAQVTQVFV